MRNESITIPAWLTVRATGDSATKNLLVVLGASILIALSAQIAVPIPFSPVPMTLQPFAILLAGAALGARRGGAAALLYLFEGAAGLPVFAQGKAGILWVVSGPTAGFLLAFPVVAFLVGWLSERGWMRTATGTIGAMTLGLATLHLFGWSWLAAMMQLGPARAFAVGTLPFLAGDAVKIVIAAAILPAAQRFVGRD